MIDDSNPENLDNLKEIKKIDIEKEMQNSFFRLCYECNCF